MMVEKRTRSRPACLQVLPGLGFWLLALAGGPLAAQVTITEIHYNPGPADPEGRRREFVEVFNTSPEPLDLSGYSFTRGLTFVVPEGSWIAGHSYLAICADPSYIRTTYSITNTLGPWDATTSLANGGETIAIAEPSGAEVVRVRYNDRGNWPGAADGTGHSLALISPYSEVNDPDSWAQSSVRGGSPGKANPAPGARPVIINEALTLTSGQRWVELYNPAAAAVDLANYHLTDDPLNLTKAKLVAPVSVPPKGWLALTDTELGLSFAPVPNPPNPGAGRVFIALVDTAGTRVVDAYTFEPDLAELTEARYPDGNEDWADASNPTPGAANEVEVETDVVINEILYHSHDDDPSDEFVELQNRGAQALALDGCRFSQGINFALPPVTLAAGRYLVVARNPDRIRALHGLPAGAVVGPAQDPQALADFGVLANAGERLTLVDARGNVMDTLRWYDGGDWPRWADGLGSSLELIDPHADNGVASSWDASDDSAKAATETFTYSGPHRGGGESELHLVLMNRGIALVDDVEIRSGGGTLVADATFVDFGASWKYLKGTAEPSNPVTAWRTTGFGDAGWSTGSAPLGYGEPDIVTTLADMRQAGAEAGYLSFYCRKTFSVADRSAVDKLFLDVRYDDGFIAYLNGTQVASRNTTGSAFNAAAATVVEPTAEQIDLTAQKSALRDGANVLAIQVHNANLPSSDALIDARLVSGHVETGGAGPNIIANGTFDADDSGWIIEGNHIESGRSTDDPITGAGSLKLIAAGRGDNKVNRIETETNPAMSTTGTYTVAFKARWVAGSRTLLTHDYQNLDTSLARSHQLNVPENLGTPGALNSVTARRIAAKGDANLGPAISRVSQSPAVPQGNEAVTVRARLRDPDGVASAKVRYYLNTPGAGAPFVPQPVGVFYDHRDVGGPCTAGNTTSSSATSYSVTGSGADIWQGGDQFQFAYTYATGDFTMTARLAAKNWAVGSKWGKGGIMARQSLSSTARYTFVHDSGADLTDYARLAGRPTDGGSDNFEAGIGAAGQHPAWLRLQRVGAIFRAFGSGDGTNWTQIAEMNWGAGAPSTVLLGLALTSHADCPTATIAFANVAITGTIGGPPDTGGTLCVAQACEQVLSDPDGDGVWTATLPGRALGQKVLFWIEAVDGAGKLERYPADVRERSHALLLDPTTTDPAAQSYCIYRHDTRNPSTGTSFHNYRFVLHDLNEAYLDQRQVHSNDPVEGSFVFGGTDLYYNSRIRFAGSPWARGKWGSFRLRFPNDKPLHGEKLSFNLDVKHGEVRSAKERISHYLFRALSRPYAKLPYAVNRMVHLWVNARDIGERDHVEVPNGELLEKWWPGDDRGDFFEMDDRFEFNDAGGRIASRDGRLTYPPYGSAGDDQEEYRWYLNLRRDEDGDNYANLIDLARLLDPADTPSVQFDALVDGPMNVESFLRNWAVRLNTDDWDSWGASRGKNCYLFRPPVEGRWYIIPWDMELSYGNVNAFPHPTGSTGGFGFGFGEVNRLLDRPRLRRLYYGILKEMIDGPFSSGFLTPYMTRLDALGLNNTQHGKVGGFIDQRRALIEGWIDPVIYPQVDFAITAPNGGNAASVATATVNLAGSAPVEVFSIGVENDAVDYNPGDVPPAVFSNSSMTQWGIASVPLAAGINNLTVTAYSSLGEVFGQDSVRITSTVAWNTPAITQLNPGSGLAATEVIITGADFHTGIEVLFGATRATQVVFNEQADPTHVRATVPDLAAATYPVRVRNSDGKQSNALNFTVTPPPPEFIRGDANMDALLDLADALKALLHLAGGQSVACRDAVDANDDGSVNVTDPLHVLLFLFRNGAPPAAPHPNRGTDATADGLDCAAGLP